MFYRLSRHQPCQDSGRQSISNLSVNIPQGLIVKKKKAGYIGVVKLKMAEYRKMKGEFPEASEVIKKQQFVYKFELSENPLL